MSLLTSLRLIFRQFLRNPGFFAIALAALALGIGANSAIFTGVEAVLLRPLPYADPGRLVMVWEDAAFIGFAHNTPAVANYVDWGKQNQVFTDMAAARFDMASLTGGQSPEQALGQGVTPNFFDVLGVQPALGRPFTAEEDKERRKVVVLSHALWQRHFNSDPALIGRTILMNGEATTVVGVMPRGFFFPDRQTDYWVPAAFTTERLANRDNHYLNVVARMKSSVSAVQAQRDMELIAKRLEKEYPESNAKLGAVVIPLQQEFAGDARIGLWVLQIASVFVLLIACSNLASLMLARASSRRREIAVRIALGASRRQLIAQLLTESLVLAIAGGALGLVLGRWSWDALGRLVPTGLDMGTTGINPKVLLFTAGISLAAGIFSGLVPALRATSVSLNDALKEGSRSGEARGGTRLRGGLVVAQFALAFALLAGAGLMIQTLWNLRRLDLGFRSDHLLTLGVPLPKTKYDTDEKRRNFDRDALDRMRALPGVLNAGFASDAPFMSEGDTNSYTVEGEPPLVPGQVNDALYREVTAGYLETLGATVREGRFLEDRDREPSLPVVVINEFLAKRHWPGQSAVGKRLRLGGEKAPWLTVAGVVADIRERGYLLGAKPAVYVPVQQVRKPEAFFLVVRTATEPASLINAVRQEVWSLDSEQPVTLIRTMDEIIDLNLADRRRPMLLLGAFAGLALLLACIGGYGVLAFAVAQRTREIGIRMALGARPVDVTKMVVGRGFLLSAVGFAAGLGLALALSRLLQSLLYGVTPGAPGIYAGAALALLVVAILACVVPALRAARVDPVVALRDE